MHFQSAFNKFYKFILQNRLPRMREREREIFQVHFCHADNGSGFDCGVWVPTTNLFIANDGWLEYDRSDDEN